MEGSRLGALKARVLLLALALLPSLASAPSRASETRVEPPPTLPEDAPQVSEVIYRMRYPFAEASFIELSPTFLVGDKFLDSKGMSLEYAHYLSETWAITTGASLFSRSITAEGAALESSYSRPAMHDPNWLLSAGVRFDPLYGKFAIGSWIQHFRFGLDAGVHAAHETILSGDASASTSSAMKLGPQLGAHLLFPVSDRFSVGLKTSMLLHGGVLPDEPSRHIWIFSTGLGYRL